jgi:hypothetical protein
LATCIDSGKLTGEVKPTGMAVALMGVSAFLWGAAARQAMTSKAWPYLF